MLSKKKKKKKERKEKDKMKTKERKKLGGFYFFIIIFKSLNLVVRYRSLYCYRKCASTAFVFFLTELVRFNA